MMRRWGLAVVVAIACTGSSEIPELTARRRALQAWERGTESLEAGRPADAFASFEEALDHRPGDPVLLSWRARAEAGQGDLDAAVATLGVALSQDPGMAQARYNLACYEARRGNLDVAGEALQRALADGAADPRDVLEDPDFVPHLRHPAFAFLPDAPLDLAVSGPDGSVFLGSEAPVRLAVRARHLERIQLEAPPVRGPVELAKVEERDEVLDGGDRVRTVTWYLRVTGAGQLDIGPFEVRADARVARAEALTVVGLAPPDHVAPVGAPVSLDLPSTLAAEDAQPLATPAVWIRDGRLTVRAGPHDRVRVGETAEPGVRWQHFTSRELDWVLHTWPAPDGPRRVRITRGGEDVLDRTVSP